MLLKGNGIQRVDAETVKRRCVRKQNEKKIQNVVGERRGIFGHKTTKKWGIGRKNEKNNTRTKQPYRELCLV